MYLLNLLDQFGAGGVFAFKLLVIGSSIHALQRLVPGLCQLRDRETERHKKNQTRQQHEQTGRRARCRRSKSL